MADLNCKLLVIGAGPGGYVCAIRAAQLGVDTVIIESHSPGGTCLNVGCIPSKALIHAADEFYKMVSASEQSMLGIRVTRPSINFTETINWKNSTVQRLNNGVTALLKKSGARLLIGTAQFIDGKTVRVTGKEGSQTVRCENVVIATGSKSVELPLVPFGDNIISSTEALSLDDVPKTIAVVGGGYIGLELGTAFAKLGTQVMLVESASKVLPHYDEDLTRPIVKRLSELGVEIMTSTTVKGVEGKQLHIQRRGSDRQSIVADRILVTVGRTSDTSSCKVEELKLTMNGAYIAIDNKCQTSMRGVYAIGDVTGEPMLAHRAMAQGQMVAEIVSGLNRAWDKRCIPAICFTDPEIVTAGLSPKEALEVQQEFDVGVFPLQANGRALTMECDTGFVRVVTDKHDGVLLGVQAVGYGVSELSTAFALAIEMGACAEDIEATVHAHPTLGESFPEACMQATGSALHI